MTRVLVLALLLTGCAGYDPPLAGDHGAHPYQTALSRCRQDAQKKADKIANATPQSAIHAIFASDEPYRQDVLACMVAKGFKPAG